MSETEAGAGVGVEEVEGGAKPQGPGKIDGLIGVRLPKEFVALIDAIVEEGKFESRSAVVRSWICGLLTIPNMTVAELVSFYSSFTKFLQFPSEPLERFLYFQFLQSLANGPEEQLVEYVTKISPFLTGFYVASSEKFREKYPELKGQISEDMMRTIAESGDVDEVRDRIEAKMLETIHSLSQDITGRLHAVAEIVVTELDR